MEAVTKSYESSRRSTRIRAQIPVRITSLDPAVELSEHCHTVVVNTQGCGVRLSRQLEAGVAVRLDELPTGQIVTAQVANCVPLGSDGKYWLVGLAMDQTGNIWGIHPAPADWGSEPKAMAAAASAAVTANLPAKKNEWPFSQFSRRGEFHPGRK
ncbi:MAG: PilZ domain-containing protein [Acidobacteriia bacterium]|nr:PilZ domain-containing protein [Terriglobia bacterium]